jgi:type II secretory pathway pseudopilin PulG
MKHFSDKNQGFSLLETVISITLVGFFVSGMMLTWTFAESRERGLDDYWAAKDELETAYEMTHHYLRGKAGDNVAILTGGTGITFTGTDGKTWTFKQDGASYKMIHGENTRTLINQICTKVEFKIDDALVSIDLAVATPSTWNSAANNDLEIDGKVLVRNYYTGY